MATYRAVASVAEAVARLLEQSWSPAVLAGIEPQFAVYHGKSFEQGMETGVSVFIFQVTVDKVQRTLPPPDSQHRRPLPLVLSLLLTAWARDASAEHDLLGWAMRAIADNPILSSGFLNSAVSGVFRPEETVELIPGELTNDEVFQLWQALPGDTLRLSACYTARLVRVDSELTEPGGAQVRVRELQLAEAGS